MRMQETNTRIPDIWVPAHNSQPNYRLVGKIWRRTIDMTGHVDYPKRGGRLKGHFAAAIITGLKLEAEDDPMQPHLQQGL